MANKLCSKCGSLVVDISEQMGFESNVSFSSQRVGLPASSPQRSGLVNITPLYDTVCYLMEGDPKTLQENIEITHYEELEEKKKLEEEGNTWFGNQYVDRYKNQPKSSDLGRRLWGSTTGPNPRAWSIDWQ